MIGVKRADSLAIRAVFSALIAVMLVSMVFSAAQVYLEFQDELKADRLALSRAVTASKPALVNAAYQLDSVLAQQLINGLLMNEIIDAVRLEDDSGAVLASGSNPPLDERMPLVSLLIDKSITGRLFRCSRTRSTRQQTAPGFMAHFISRLSLVVVCRAFLNATGNFSGLQFSESCYWSLF